MTPPAILLASALFAALVVRLRQVVVPLDRDRFPRRTNVSGIEVPVSLGDSLVIGAASSALLANAVIDDPGSRRIVFAHLLALAVMAVAGAWDDRRGDERPRGFKGHLGALRGGVLTGGLVKVVAGGVAGLGAGWITAGTTPRALGIAACVALAANLVNLFDRAPGRALKVSLLLTTPLLFAAPGVWVVLGAGLVGATIVCLPVDLGERAMLGDAGANPLGASIGLGIGISTSGVVMAIVIAALLCLNLASERWSFSTIIETTRPLHALDRAGRGRARRK